MSAALRLRISFAGNSVVLLLVLVLILALILVLVLILVFVLVLVLVLLVLILVVLLVLILIVHVFSPDRRIYLVQVMYTYIFSLIFRTYSQKFKQSQEFFML